MTPRLYCEENIRKFSFMSFLEVFEFISLTFKRKLVKDSGIEGEFIVFCWGWDIGINVFNLLKHFLEMFGLYSVKEGFILKKYLKKI